MAQKDIQAIAEYMNQLNESKAAEDKKYEKALNEERQFEAEDIESTEIEDEIIDPSSMGFIDDTDMQDESDAFYAENEESKDIFAEDVSDCMDDGKGCIDESEGLATLTIEVYNEDGFGEHFTQEVMKNVPGVEAKAMNNKTPQGDLVVKIVGPYEDLVKAFNFYIGKSLNAPLVGDDKDEFDASLVYADGDTIAEADYREAVAHCLDPIGVDASTANLVKKDTCALSIIKEEKCRRKAAKFMKALREDDLSELTDLDLDTLDTIKDAMDNQETAELEAEDARIWAIILDQMGYTQDEWDKMTPEQQEKNFNKNLANNPTLTRTGFADYFLGSDPKDRSKIRKYSKAYGGVFNPETQDVETIAFNPDYSAEDSIYQHPGLVKKAEKKRQQAEYDARREAMRKDAMRSARGKDTWTKEDFVKMISTLTGDERKKMFKSLIADIEATAETPQQAANETMFVRNLFGKKPTLRTIAQAWDRTFPGVKIYADYVEGALYKAAREATGLTLDNGALGKLETDPIAKEKFIEIFNREMNDRKSRGSETMDPERAARRSISKQEIKKAVEDVAK